MFKILSGIFLLTGCNKKYTGNEGLPFEGVPISKNITPGIIDEASGIADSKINAGSLWVEQDSGNPNDISLISDSGQVLKKITIKSATNRDWEDMVLAKGPTTGVNYLYVADIGDNNKSYSQYRIYRFPEPTASTDTVFAVDSIRFQYPDGSHDAEAILVDNSSKDIYVITKQDSPSRIYKLSYPQNLNAVNTAVAAGSLPFTGVVSAARSGRGELLLKTYSTVYYWKNDANANIEQTLSSNPVQLDCQFEPQGEAICFKSDDGGFYTLSERPPVVSSVSLNFYRRM